MYVKYIIIACLYLSAGMAGLLALCALRRLNATGAKACTGVMLCIAIYTFGYGLELSNTTLEGIRFSLRIEYLGISFLPALWLIMAMKYSGYGQNISRWAYAAIFIVPVLTLILQYTSDSHQLFYKSFGIDRSGPFPLAAFEKGIWYQINILYLNACILAGNILFYLMMIHSAGQYRKQAVVLFTASLFPWIGNVIYQAGLSPYGIDLNPFFLTLTAPAFAIALFRFRMFDLVPIARDTVFNIMHDPVVILDSNNRLADFNAAARELFSDLESSMIGQNVEIIFKAFPHLRSKIAGSGANIREIETTKDGETVLFDARHIPIWSKKAAGTLIIFHDITSQRKLQDRLQELAIRDGLTSCYNRRHLMELLKEELERAKRYARPFSIILIDLDHFKKINDTYGHQIGDKVLHNSAEVFFSRLRSCDILGRYGGEEFAVLLPETGPMAAFEIAERLRGDLEKSTIRNNDQSLSITASFGVAGMSQADPAATPATLLQSADEALYLAKRKGRNRVEKL